MRLIISGGGTGGHIYPALALIETVKQHEPDSEILYVGTEKGLESQIVRDAGIAFKSIKIQGFKRALSFENVKTVALFLRSIQTAKKIIREFAPDVVVGTGGYVCSAVVFAASRLHIPTMIHEQNSVAGVTNKFLGHFVDKVGICFPDAASAFPQKKVVLTGNPRAQQVSQMHLTGRLATEYGLTADKPTLLIFGGSRGALHMNEAVADALPLFGQHPEYQVLFATGKVHYDMVMERIGNKVPSNVVVKPYIPDMPAILPEVACIVGRAGATSLAEITAIGIPSILIPSPYVTNDHQTKNAKSLVNRGAAELLPEEGLTGKKLFACANKLMADGSKRQEMTVRARQAGMPDAADRVYAILRELITTAQK